MLKSISCQLVIRWISWNGKCCL